MDKPTVELLARAIRDNGTPAGPRSLLSFVGALIPFTSSLITLLARGGRPVLLYDDIRPERREVVGGAYLRGAYLLDPFHDYLLDGPRERVVPLQDIQPDHFRKSRYFSSYYAGVGLADEIGIFAERRDGTAIFPPSDAPSACNRSPNEASMVCASPCRSSTRSCSVSGTPPSRRRLAR